MPISFRFEEQLIDEISAYCKWLSIARFQDFFEQAADYILQNDKEWKQEKTIPKATTVAKNSVKKLTYISAPQKNHTRRSGKKLNHFADFYRLLAFAARL